MIEQLKEEIRDLERTIEIKKDELKKMMEAALFEKPKLLVLVEMRDQFCGITDILLIDDTELAIKEVEEEHNKNFMYCNRVFIYRLTDKEQLKEDYTELKNMKNLGHYGESSLYQWMEENEKNLVNPE